MRKGRVYTPVMTLKNAAFFAFIGMTLLTVVCALGFIGDTSALLAGAIADDGGEIANSFPSKPECCSLPLRLPQNAVLNDPVDGHADRPGDDRPIETVVGGPIRTSLPSERSNTCKTRGFQGIKDRHFNGLQMFGPRFIRAASGQEHIQGTHVHDAPIHVAPRQYLTRTNAA